MQSFGCYNRWYISFKTLKENVDSKRTVKSPSRPSETVNFKISVQKVPDSNVGLIVLCSLEVYNRRVFTESFYSLLVCHTLYDIGLSKSRSTNSTGDTEFSHWYYWRHIVPHVQGRRVLVWLLNPEYLLTRLNIPQNLDLRHPYCQYITEKYRQIV